MVHIIVETSIHLSRDTWYTSLWKHPFTYQETRGTHHCGNIHSLIKRHVVHIIVETSIHLSRDTWYTSLWKHPFTYQETHGTHHCGNIHSLIKRHMVHIIVETSIHFTRFSWFFLNPSMCVAASDKFACRRKNCVRVIIINIVFNSSRLIFIIVIINVLLHFVSVTWNNVHIMWRLKYRSSAFHIIMGFEDKSHNVAPQISVFSFSHYHGFRR